MRKQIYALCLCLITINVFTACVSKKKFSQLLNDKEAIDQMLNDKEKMVKDLENNVTELEDTKATMETEFRNEKTKLVGELDQSQKDLEASKEEVVTAQKVAEENAEKLKAMEENVKGAFETYAKSGLNILQKNDLLYVDPVAPIRYGSGSTRIDEEGKTALASMAEVLVNNPDIKILVEGHTDNVPLIEGARFKNNIELSYARANKVVSELVNLGVNPNQLSAVGRGENMPLIMDENNSDEAKAMNRRTEFVVLANVGGLYELTEGT